MLRFLSFILLLEIAGGGYLFWQKSQQVSPLLPDLAYVDPLSRPELEALAADVRQQQTSSAWQNFAEALIGKGYYVFGHEAFREAERLDPDNIAAAQGVAFCLDRVGQTAAANKIYTKLISRTTGEQNQLIRYAIARNLLRMEQPDAALPLFAENRSFLPANLLATKLLVKSGNSAQAYPEIERVLQLLPQSLLFQQLKSQAAAQLNLTTDYQQAEAEIERAELLIPVNFNTDFLTKKNLQFGIGRHWQEYQQVATKLGPDEKLKIVRELLDSQAGYLSPYTLIMLEEAAAVAIDTGASADAERYLQQLEKQGVRNSAWYRIKGDLAWANGETRQAISHWQTSAEMTPAVETFDKLADALQVQSPEQAKFYRGRAAQELGLEQYQSDKIDSARRTFEQAVQFNQQLEISWFYLGEIYRLQQQDEKAIAAWQRCLQINPRHGRALKWLARITRQGAE